ncbi:MAG: hypothetical protein ACRD4V_15560 [Candidatus Acidiferrales bacterium]
MKSQGSTALRYGLIVLAGLFYLLAPTSYAQSSASVAQANLDYLVRNAQTVVRGNVVSAVLQPDPQFSNLQTVVVTIQVAKTLKGQALPTLTFRQYVWNSKDVTGPGGYHKAEQILLFLNPVSAYGLTSPVGMEQGQFRVLHDSKGNLYALNGRGNVGLFTNVLTKSEARGVTFSTRAKTMLSKRGGQVPLGALEETIQALVGARP